MQRVTVPHLTYGIPGIPPGIPPALLAGRPWGCWMGMTGMWWVQEDIVATQGPYGCQTMTAGPICHPIDTRPM